MSENLNYAAKCSGCYDNKPANCQKYGRMYDVSAAWRACPKGWHLPEKEEWDILFGFVTNGKAEYPSETAAKYLKAKSGWNGDKNGEDKYGFSALPGGVGRWDGNFSDVGDRAAWCGRDGGICSIYSPYGDEGGESEVLIYEMDPVYVRCLQNDANYAAKEAEMAKEIAEEEKAEKAAAKSRHEKAKNVKKGSFTDDRDKRTYKTVTLEKQTWMAENLNYETVEGSQCLYNENSNCKEYGRLYDKKTALKVCPNGWHLPSEEEWKILIEFANGWNYLKAKKAWGYANICFGKQEDYTDDYGFSALPSDYGSPDGSVREGSGSIWWNAEGSYASIYPDGVGASIDWSSYLRDDNFNTTVDDKLFSVRCLQD